MSPPGVDTLSAQHAPRFFSPCRCCEGSWGLTLPYHMLPLACESDTGGSCIEWLDTARLYVDYEQSSHIHCYHLNWTSQADFTYPYDCYELGNAHWYGGMLPAAADFQHLHFDRTPFLTSTVNAPGGLGPVVEPLWLTSNNVAIYVEGNPPLHIELNVKNSSRFCLVSLYVESPYEHGADVSSDGGDSRGAPWLNYTVCTGSNMRDLHRYMLSRLGSEVTPPPPNTNKFTDVLYSTWAQFKDSVNQVGLLDYMQRIVSDQLAKGLCRS